MPFAASIRFSPFRFLLVVALILPAALHAAEGGKFQFVTGDVRIVSADGKERAVAKGESFNTGDTLITGASGTAQIRMNDGGMMAIRANTQLKLDQYVFNGREDGNERSLLSLVKGGFRTITGLIGNRNKDNYKIVTPSATIGIRGTDHEPVVVPAGAAGGFQPGTYDRVYRGATIIETEKGKLIVNPNQVGFTPGKGAAPVILPKIPEFYDVKPQLPNASKDTDKSQDSGDSSKKSDVTKTDSARSLSNVKSLKDVDTSDLSVRTPLDTSTTTKDVGTTTLRSDTLKSTLSTDSVKSLSTDTLTTPLTDTSRATTTTLDTSVSNVKTDALTTPTTTLKSTTSPAVSSTTPLTTTTPTTTLTAPVTTTLTAPTTTTLTAPVTTITAPVTTTTVAPVTKSVDTTLTAPTTTIQKSLITR